ncbi:MAG: hypothetical protein HW412_2325 [Bacteroidetes bacterium]|nr:hypothetical protein [Bacteroidota bacterium]
MTHNILALLCASVLLVGTSIAQRQEAHWLDQTMKELTEKLELTTQQQDTIHQILEESAVSMREARAVAGGNRNDMMQMMKSI